MTPYIGCRCRNARISAKGVLAGQKKGSFRRTGKHCIEGDKGHCSIMGAERTKGRN